MTEEPVAGPMSGTLDPTNLIACPKCDALHRIVHVAPGERALCHRCHTVIMAPQTGAMTRIVMLAVTSAVLMTAAVFFPFLDLSAAGITTHSSLFDAVLAFSSGLLLPLSFATAALIVLLPMLRFGLIIYTLAPMALGWRPAPQSILAFRLAQSLRPWAMAEIFIVGVVVALVKVAGLATVTLGPAFWAFVALVLVTTLSDTVMCETTIWKTLEERRKY